MTHTSSGAPRPKHLSLVADNQLTLDSIWDLDFLRGEIKALKGTEIDLDMLRAINRLPKDACDAAAAAVPTNARS